jgi:hypothetical protein
MFKDEITFCQKNLLSPSSVPSKLLDGLTVLKGAVVIKILLA